MVIFGRPAQAPPSQGDEEFIVKRAIGLSGDKVSILHGRLILNGDPVAEPYIRSTPWSSWPMDNSEIAPVQIAVPPNSVFVLGDNREMSTDSRLFGAIADEDLVGVVVFSFH